MKIKTISLRIKFITIKKGRITIFNFSLKNIINHIISTSFILPFYILNVPKKL